MPNGNGKKSGEKGKPVVVVEEDPEVKRKRILHNRKGQFYLLRLAEILGVEPFPTSDKNKGFTFEFEGLYLDLTEVFERAVKKLEQK